MVVSTSRMIGLMSSSEVSFSIEMFSSGLSSDGMHIEGQSLGRFVEHALRLLGLLEQVGDLGEGRDPGDDALAEQSGDLVEHHQLGWGRRRR